MRAFIGIQIPSDIRCKIASFKREKLKKLRSVKEVEDENLHITMKFLGEIDDSKARDVSEEMKRINFVVFEAQVKGVGVFPNIHGARVIWVGVESPEIFELKRKIDETLEKIGFEKDNDFTPHITMARVKGREDPKVIEEIISASRDFGRFTVEEIILFQSILTPRGPIYKKIEGIPLVASNL